MEINILKKENFFKLSDKPKGSSFRYFEFCRTCMSKCNDVIKQFLYFYNNMNGYNNKK